MVSGVGVLDKSVSVLSAVYAGGPMSLAELVAATGLSRPTAHRLAAALEDHQLLRRDAAGRWRLGHRLLEWGAAAAGEAWLLDAARPVLVDLRDRTGESVQLYVRDGDIRVCVVSLDRRSGLRDSVAVGAVLPLGLGSGGRVLLDGPEVRRRGWAESAAEREEGVASVSAPVRDTAGEVVAAVCISGPIQRLGRSPGRRYASAVVDAARDVERRAAGAG